MSEYNFKIVPTFEKYYNENSNWGCYDFYTYEDVPYCKEYKKGDGTIRVGTLIGKIQKLTIGTEYQLFASIEYNKKYHSYQYKADNITAIAPKSIEEQQKFLETIITNKQSRTLLESYPNIVEDVINGIDNIDFNKTKGIKEYTWNQIKDKIIQNYVLSDILIMLQPLGVTYNKIKKLTNWEPNLILLKDKLLDNPYIMTKIDGLGFKSVDDLALKINPALKISSKRVYSFLKYYFEKIGEDEGHTWVLYETLENSVRDNINECIEEFKSVYEIEKSTLSFLYIDDNKVGLAKYHNIEKSILNKLIELNSYNKNWDINIDNGIEEAEDEQGFKYIDSQKKTIKKAIDGNVIILSGAAGVGKSTIMRAILKTYKKYQISCAALSAKASQRITEATGFDSSTIHRLLGADEKGFRFNKDNQLFDEVFFIDECSMINAGLFYSLLSAIKNGSKIILCGDDKQLPPIGYGNIFSDLLLMDDVFNVIKLTKVMRQAEKSGILKDANIIRKGDYPIGNPQLKINHGDKNDMCYMFRDDKDNIQDIAIKAFLSSSKQYGLDETVIIVPRKSDCKNSTYEINNRIQDELIQNDVPYIQFYKRKYKLGAKVIQRKNNYDKNIFNGDTGYITKIWDEQNGKNILQKFEVTFKISKEEKVFEFEKKELEYMDLAYCLTVHLVQGGGFKATIIIIDNTHYVLLDSCLLYTAITRAKIKCLLLAEPMAFKTCINRNKSINRQTWLRQDVLSQHSNVIKKQTF